MLVLKKDPDVSEPESYNVLCDGRYVGRIFYAGAGAPKDRPWFWGVEFHEWQGCKGPQYGDAEDQASAMAADRPPLSGPGGMLVESLSLRQRGRRSRSA